MFTIEKSLGSTSSEAVWNTNARARNENRAGPRALVGAASQQVGRDLASDIDAAKKRKKKIKPARSHKSPSCSRAS